MHTTTFFHNYNEFFNSFIYGQRFLQQFFRKIFVKIFVVCEGLKTDFTHRCLNLQVIHITKLPCHLPSNAYFLRPKHTLHSINTSHDFLMNLSIGSSLSSSAAAARDATSAAVTEEEPAPWISIDMMRKYGIIQSGTIYGTIQSWAKIPRNSQSYLQFQNNALWDTLNHAHIYQAFNLKNHIQNSSVIWKCL